MGRAFLGAYQPAATLGLQIGASQFEKYQQDQDDRRSAMASAGVMAKLDNTTLQDFFGALDTAAKSGDLSPGQVQSLATMKTGAEQAKANLLMKQKEMQQSIWEEMSKRRVDQSNKNRQYNLDRMRENRLNDQFNQRYGPGGFEEQERVRGITEDARKNTIASLDDRMSQFGDTLKTFAPNYSTRDIDAIAQLYYGQGGEGGEITRLTPAQRQALGVGGIRQSLIGNRIASNYKQAVREGTAPADLTRIIGDAKQGRGSEALARFSPRDQQETLAKLQEIDQRGDVDVIDDNGRLTPQGEKYIAQAILYNYVTRPSQEENQRIEAMIRGDRYEAGKPPKSDAIRKLMERFVKPAVQLEGQAGARRTAPPQYSPR